MAILELKKGNLVLYGKRKVIINKIFDLSRVEILDVETGNKFTVSINELQPYENTTLLEDINSSPFHSSELCYDFFLPENIKKEVDKRYQIVRQVLSSSNQAQTIKELSQVYKIHPSTIYRWLKKFIEGEERFSALIPKYKNRGGKAKSKLPKEVEEIVTQVIENVYLNPSRRVSVFTVYKLIMQKCKEKGLKAPCLNTVRARINNLTPYEVFEKRHGKVKAQSLYGASEKSLEANYPLEFVQIDHTLLDLYLIDETGNPLGRPYITVAIDVYSRAVLGYYLSLDTPNYFSVSKTLYMVMTPKDELLKEYEVEDKWDMVGIPEKICVDNAMEFRSQHLENFCKEYGILIEYRPKKTPHFGGIIERFFRTLNTKIHELPGTTFSNPKEKGEYKPHKYATFTIYDFEKWLLTFIASYYHKTIHSELQTTPENKFKQGLAFRPKPLKIITGNEAKRLRIAILPSFTRPVHKDGVHFQNVRYFDAVLKPYIGKKEKYTFKYDPGDMRFIYFLDPKTNEYFKIPCRNRKLPKITLWEIKNIYKNYFLNKKHNEEQLLIVLEKLNKIVEDAKNKKMKKIKRKQVMKKYEEEREKILFKQEESNEIKTKVKETDRLKEKEQDEEDIKPFEIW